MDTIIIVNIPKCFRIDFNLSFVKTILDDYIEKTYDFWKNRCKDKMHLRELVEKDIERQIEDLMSGQLGGWGSDEDWFGLEPLYEILSALGYVVDTLEGIKDYYLIVNINQYY